jgi:hypothetical protein
MKKDDDRPSALERARGGEWDAFEDLLGQTVAPTFDAAIHLLDDPATAEAASEEALFGLLTAVRRGSFHHGDPLKFTARSLVRTARGASRSPFAEGFGPEDLTQLGLPPTDGRGRLFGKQPELERFALTLDVALDLEPRDLAFALEKPEAEVAPALDRALQAVPVSSPRNALRDLFDARAARHRVPPGLEDRVLDRLEKAW